MWYSAVGCIVPLILSLLVAPLVTQAQQGTRVYRVGFLTPLSASPEPSTLRAFRQSLQELGYVEGSNVLIETRFAAGRSERLPALVAELLGLRLDVLLAGSTSGAVAAKQASTMVPIVFAGVADPIGSGIVASLAHPGGNITGVTVGLDAHIAGKWVELLKEAVPPVSHVAALSHAAYPLSGAHVQEMQTAARSLHVKLDVLEAGNATDLERALAVIGASRAEGIIVTAAPFFVVNRARIAQFAASKRLPAVHFSKLFAEAGGLMSYGGSLEDSYRRAAVYVDKILKGAQPADLPVEQPTKFELVLNLKTAEALGLTLPPTLLILADEVIR